MKLPSIVLYLSLCFIGCRAGFKDPAWKHCMHPLHAMPKEWGRITSPGYPDGINTQIQCSWIISSNPGYRVKIAFQTLNMTGSLKSCFTQFVELLDYKAGTSMGKFCGTRRPGDFVSYGTRLRFDLQGDTSGAKTKGFDVRFKATKEPGGFKSKWSFAPKKPSTPKASKGRPKKNRRPNSKPKPKPARPGPGAGGQPRKPPPEAVAPTLPPSGPLPSKKPAPARTAPPRIAPLRPTQKNRIPFQSPPIAKHSGPVIYGPKAGVRGVDHGSSGVISVSDKPEKKLNIYVIVGIAAGGVVAIIIIVLIMKFCVFDKSRKKRERRLEMEKQKAQNLEHESYNMAAYPGSVPEHYMSEQIMPERMQSYHHMQPLPMVSSMHQHYPPPYAHSLKSVKSRNGAPMMVQTLPHDMRSMKSRTRSSRSRARSLKSRDALSGRSRRSEVRRTKSRSSIRRSNSRNSLRRSKSKSLQYLPPMDGQWIMIDQRHPPEFGAVKPYPQSSDIEPTSSSGSSELESDSSYEPRRRGRSKTRGNPVPRMKSHPPPYDSLAQNTVPYYVINKSRDLDDGYHTGKRSAESKSLSSEKKRTKSRTTRSRASDKEKRRGKKIRRKHSY